MEPEMLISQQGAVAELTHSLRKLLSLKHIYIIPSELVGHEEWLGSACTTSGAFNVRLGKAASPILERELRAVIAFANAEGRRPNDHRSRTIRIGVAGGQTVYAAVENMRPIGLGSVPVTVAPVVIGAVPGHRYSACSIAETLATKIRYCNDASPGINEAWVRSEVETIEEWTVPSNPGSPYQVQLQHDVAVQRNHGDVDGPSFANFDYLLVGVGQWDPVQTNSNLNSHVKQVFGGHAPPSLRGDICSRLFGATGEELKPETQDAFVAISFAQLRHLIQNHRPVIALVGGLGKIDAMESLLVDRILKRPSLGQKGALVNGLITDELSARYLETRTRQRIDKLRKHQDKGQEKRQGVPSEL
jgi:DNA-binding transcriptional regulator LsrR (DeoR family)